MKQPLVGITCDNRENTAASGRYESPLTYSRAVTAAGGAAVLLPHEPDAIDVYLQRCDALVFTGGVDPRTEAFGEPTHPLARPMDDRRQTFELALLEAAERRRPDLPMLGVCLGMQLMALHAGGRLHQHLPEVLGEQAAAAHQADRTHGLRFRHHPAWLNMDPAEVEQAAVVSYHHQSVADAGRMRVLATAPDGVIEAIDDPARRFCVGVQWHPERGKPTGDDGLSLGLYRALIDAARSTT